MTGGPAREPDDPARRLRAIDWSALEGLGAVAANSLAEVLAGKPAERAIDRLLRAHRGFSAAQRTAVVEAIFGVALWRRRLAEQIGARWNDETHPRELPPLAATLLCALLRDLGGVDEARALALSACHDIAPLRMRSLAPAQRCSLPDWLWEILAAELPSPGERDAADFAAAICAPGPLFLRANRLRTDRHLLREALASEGIESEPCAFAPDGLRVTSARPNLLACQAFRDGLFEAQDEGSQLLGELLEARAGERVLDFCAGAGGKSLQLAAAVGAGGRVFCADVDAAKLARLRARARRAGATCIETLESVPGELLVDRVLVDAPCSELGALRRGPDARFRIDRAALETLPGLQRELLVAAARHVRPGGRLVYATCTLRRAENEEVASQLDRARQGFARMRPCMTLLPGGVRGFFRGRDFKALPHLHGTDGFFAAAWERRTS